MSMNETVYAGIGENDNALFTGPLVYHEEDDVKRCCTRRTTCPDGASRYSWRPNKNTPDLVYYQCATHFFLGWKISVRD